MSAKSFYPQSEAGKLAIPNAWGVPIKQLIESCNKLANSKECKKDENGNPLVHFKVALRRDDDSPGEIISSKDFMLLIEGFNTGGEYGMLEDFPPKIFP